MTAISAASPARGPPDPKLHICQGRVAEKSIHPRGRPGAAIFHARAMRARFIQTER